jgi:RHS repeat-associated protein
MKQLMSRTISAVTLSLSSIFLLVAPDLPAGDSLGTWTDRNMASTDFDVYGLAYGNDTFVAVGEDYTGKEVKYYVGTSPDGKTWVRRAAGSKSSAFNQVIFSQGRFIAVCKMPDGGGARIFISDSKGAKWKGVASGIDEFGEIVAGGLHAVASDDNGTLIAVGATPYGSGWITRSTDNGSTWNVVKTGVGGALYGVGHGAGQWFAFSGSSSLRSPDAGTTWTAIPGGPTVSDKGYKLATDGRQIVVATATGPKWSGDGGTTWNAGVAAVGFEAVGTLNEPATSVIYADGLFVLCTAAVGDAWTSETGVTWKRWELPDPAAGWMKAHALCHAKKAFWCGGWFGLLAQSPKWFKPRLGLPGDYPFTLFDGEDGPPRRIGLPTYRVNTSALNLALEGTLFYARTWNMPVHLRLAYGSAPCPDGAANIGLFGKNWRFRYESVVGRFGQEAQLLNGAGRSHLFITPGGEDLDSTGSTVTLVSPPGNFDTLVYKPSGPSFELTLAKQRLTYVYGAVVDSSIFHLTEIRDRFGNTLTFNVNTTNGQINWLRDPLGQQFTFSYSGGLCSGISMPDGRTVGFAYDADKNLTGMTDMMGYAATYTYDDDGFLATMTTAGKTNTFAWKPRPGYEDPAAENAGDQYVRKVTRPDGTAIRYELLDDGGTVRRIGADGAVTTFTNEDGNTTRVVDPMGNLRSIAYNQLKLPATITDGKGASVTYQYDSRGNVTRTTTPLGHATTYTYDGNDNLLNSSDPLGNTWVFAYDGSNRLASATSPLGNATVLAYFNQGAGAAYNGQLRTLTDPRGKIATLGYDGFGNIASVTDPAGGVSTFAFDARGYRCTGTTDPNGKTKTATWDNNDRLLGVTHASVAGTPAIAYDYNAFGQTEFTDELGQATTIARNSFGLPTSVTDPLGNVSRTEYDDDLRPIRQVDPLGRATSTVYDAADRPTLVTDARGYDFVREYDGNGNLSAIKDRNRAKTTYAYDADNRLVAATDPLKQTAAVAYDPTGRPTTQTNARGQQVLTTYDDDGRLATRSHKASAKAAAVNAATYTYDAAGNITAVVDAWGVTDMEYDDAGRLTKITYPNTGGTRHEASFTWKPGGQLATVAYPGGFIVGYTYDGFNRLPIPRQLQGGGGGDLVGGGDGIANRITQVTMALGLDPQGDFTMTYDNRASLTRLDRPNLTRTDYAYDNAGRLTQVAHTDPGTATNLLTADYALDAIGNVATETLVGTHAFTPATLPATMAFAYNLAGQLTAKGSQKAASDPDGNLIKVDNATTAEYDAENHLTKIVRKTPAGTVTATYTVNHAGLVVKRETGGETIHYHYGPGNVPLFTTDANGDVIEHHAWLGRLLLATRKADASYVHYYGDRQGHVRFLLDEDKTHLVSYGYPPYGPAVASVDGIDNAFTFNGLFGVRDEGDNLFLMQQRFYDAVAGRFLQRDPLGYGAGPNLLAFAAGNPLYNADPDGQEIVTLCLFWAGAALLAGAVAERTVKYLKDREGDELRAQRQLHFTRQQNRMAAGNNPNNAGIEAALNEHDESRQRWNAGAEYVSDSAHYVGDLTYETGKFVAVNKGSDFIGGKILTAGKDADQLGGAISFGYSAGEEAQSRMPTPPNTENASSSQEISR